MEGRRKNCWEVMDTAFIIQRGSCLAIVEKEEEQKAGGKTFENSQKLVQEMSSMLDI
jgi:hypothetical protein